MQAIVLAGGKGTRLRPYTTIFPKPLVPIGESPILEVIIKQLKYYGFNDMVFTVGYLKELIMAFFGDGNKWDINITYSVEEHPLGTAGPLKLIERIDDNFLVINGDILTDIDYGELFKYHKNNNAICTIATFKKPVNIDLGILKTNNDSLITDYIEKPTLHYDVSMGVYVFNKKALDFIPDLKYYDIPTLILTLIENREKIISYKYDGLWLDIGRSEDYEMAIQIFNNNKEKLVR